MLRTINGEDQTEKKNKKNNIIIVIRLNAIDADAETTDRVMAMQVVIYCWYLWYYYARQSKITYLPATRRDGRRGSVDERGKR